MHRVSRDLIALVLGVGSIGAGAAARADAMTPWSGASASAQVFVPAADAATQTGATATASSGKSQEVPYFGGIATDYDHPYRVSVSGSADARATGKADGLLHLDASYSAPNPGTTPRIQPADLQLPVGAQAAWNGDRLTVQAPAGSNLPGTVRLNFSVGFQGRINDEAPSSQGSNVSSIAINANGLAASIDRTPDTSYFGRTDFRPGTLGFDSTSRPSFSPVENQDHYGAIFHIDLPLSASGLSDPFSVGLSASTSWGLSSNRDFASSIKDLTLSLTSITTPDGTPLSDLGDTVTFASGMLAPGAQPTPVPEPSATAVMAIGLMAMIVRRLRDDRRHRIPG